MLDSQEARPELKGSQFVKEQAISTPPNNETWERVQAIFAEALQVPPERQQLLVRDRCGGNGALLDEVQSLLSAYLAGEADLEQPPDLNVRDAKEIEPWRSNRRKEN